MTTAVCGDCKHFHQHYGINDRRIFRLYCGHCTQRRTAARKPDRVACDLFEPAGMKEDTFVSKEYLSKELLRYILEMELLPEILDLSAKEKE